MSALIVLLFAAGYVAIVLEHPLRVDKAATGLVTGVLCWSVYALSVGAGVGDELLARVSELAGILFFLLGAMTIIELVDAHDGFAVITARITTRDRRTLLVVVALITFFLSALVDNLTTSIFMVSVLRKLIRDEADRCYYGGIVVIAANAGGCWCPIGDVTTTMLWIGTQVTTGELITQLLLPALISVLVPLGWLMTRVRGTLPPLAHSAAPRASSGRDQKIVLVTGVGALAFVPVFKSLTHLPPFMGVLLGLGVLWIVTGLLRKPGADRSQDPRTVAAALQRIDTPTILFFLGILLAIAALQSAGVLHALTQLMDRATTRTDAITITVGLASSVIDNVPLVGAMQAMYPLSTFPTDHHFWIFLAYCAGTGGSILIIGSAAGVATMGLQRITFGWYLRRFSLPALAGYFAGALCYLGLRALLA